MRTTLDLDRQLLEEARDALGAASFTEAIETALRDSLARVHHRRAWEALEGSGRSWESVDELLAYRRRHGDRAL